jgi:hypothetical protein
VSEPHQQGFEAQGVQIKLAKTAVRGGQIVPVDLDPDIAQQQRNADKQEAQGRVAGGGLDASLAELTVAGVDAEAIAVDREEPLSGFRLKAPERINEPLASVASASPSPLATMHADAHGGPAVIGAGQRVARPTAALPECKDPGTARTLGVSGFPSPDDHGHEG